MRNGYKSHRGRSAVARRVMTSGGSVNGMMPTVNVMGVVNGRVRVVTPAEGAAYFGGPKKGGSAPSGTGFMIPKSSSYQPYGVFPLRNWSGCNVYTENPPVSLNGSACIAPHTSDGGNATYTTYRQNFSLGNVIASGPLL